MSIKRLFRLRNNGPRYSTKAAVFRKKIQIKINNNNMAATATLKVAVASTLAFFEEFLEEEALTKEDDVVDDFIALLVQNVL